MLTRFLIVVFAVVVGYGAAPLAQETLMTELAPTTLKEQLQAARELIATLPKRACGPTMVTMEWNKLTKLFDDRIARVKGKMPGSDNLHILQGLHALNTLVREYARYSEEVCAHDKRFRDHEQSVRQWRKQVLSSFSRIVKDIRGNRFPFATFGQFDTWYNAVDWGKKAGQTHSLVRMTAITLGKLPGVNSRKQKYKYFSNRATVDNGRVRVTVPAGSQQMWYRFDKGLPHVFALNPFVWIAGAAGADAARMANELFYGATQQLTDGPRLSFGPRTKFCRGKSSAYRCAGSLLRRVEAAAGGYRLSTMVGRQMSVALQEHVTAACERRIDDGSAVLSIIDARRPKRDRSVQVLYDRAAIRFQSRVSQLKASGKDEMCGPETSEFLFNVARVAVESSAQPELDAPGTTNANWGRRLQRALDEMVKFWSCGHVLSPRFPAAPKATCEMAGVYPGGRAGTTSTHTNRTRAGDNARIETTPQVNSGRERLTPEDLLARADDRSLSARARVSFAARAAQGFRSAVAYRLRALIVGASPAEDHAAAVVALGEINRHAILAAQARSRVGSASDTVASVQEHLNVALNAAHAASAIAREWSER